MISGGGRYEHTEDRLERSGSVAIDDGQRIGICDTQMTRRDSYVFAVLAVRGIQSFETLATTRMVDQLQHNKFFVFSFEREDKEDEEKGGTYPKVGVCSCVTGKR